MREEALDELAPMRVREGLGGRAQVEEALESYKDAQGDGGI